MKKQIVLLLVCALNLPLFAQKQLTDTVMGLHHHTSDITHAMYSLGGRRLITTGMDRQVYFFESTNWIELHKYSHMAPVTQVAISRDDAIIASASQDNYLKIYFLDSAKMLEFEQESEITGIAIDYGMRMLYTSSSDGHIRPYDLKKGEYTKRKYALGMPISALTVTHNNMIVAGLKNGEIKIMNPAGQVAKTLSGHVGEITSLYYVFFKNQMYLTSASIDNTIKIWDLKTNKELKTLKGHTWTITSVELSRDLKYVVSASKDGTARVWSVETGEQVLTIENMGEAVTCASIGEKNEFLATTHIMRDPREYVVYLWETGLLEKEPEKKTPTPATPKKK